MKEMKWILFLGLISICAINAQERIKSEQTDAIEKQMSLIKPFSTVEGEKLSNDWSVNGNAQFEMNFVNIQSGLVFNNNELKSDNWEAVLHLTAQAKSSEGGLAFWYVSLPGIPGDAYGALSKYNGLGVFLQNKKDEPYLSVQTNDGNNNADVQSITSQLVGCSLKGKFDHNGGSGKIKIRYFNGLLSIFYKFNIPVYTACGRSVSVKLPERQRIMISAKAADSESYHINSLRLFDLDPIVNEPLTSIKAQMNAIDLLEAKENSFTVNRGTNSAKPNVQQSVVTPQAIPKPTGKAPVLQSNPENTKKLAESFHKLHTDFNDFYKSAKENLLDKMIQTQIPNMQKRSETINKLSILSHKRSDSTDLQSHNYLERQAIHHVPLKDTGFASSFDGFKDQVNSLQSDVVKLYTNGDSLQTSMESFYNAMLKNIEVIDEKNSKAREINKAYLERHTEIYNKVNGLGWGTWFLIAEAAAIVSFFIAFRARHKRPRSRV